MAATKKKHSFNEYPDDIFANTRMSFGDHIEELRIRMFLAIKWLVLFMILGFILDAIGEAMDRPNFGVGRPMLKVITEPVELQVRDFYNRRINALAAEQMAQPPTNDAAEIERIREKLVKNNNNLSALTEAERVALRTAYAPLDIIVPTEPLAQALGIPPAQITQQEVRLTAQVVPAKLTILTEQGQGLIGFKQHLSTLSVQEGFVVYFKVSILCGIVLASPFILYQFWAFIGAGLYPHEKKHVYMLFGPSLVLFLAGVFLCQFVVLPGAVKALLGFNEWLGFDPDIRLREWLSLAIILPLVFGASFQTPLVMIFLNRIGMFTAEDYLAKWRMAVMILALFAALITPTPDVVTMLYLFGPMFGLYLVGILICYYFPGIPPEDLEAEASDEVAV